MIARPLPTLATTNQVLEPDLEEALVDPGNVAPDIVTEEKPTVDETEEPAPPPEVEGSRPAPIVTGPVEEPEPDSELVEQEISALAIAEPAVAPATEEPALHVLHVGLILPPR